MARLSEMSPEAAEARRQYRRDYYRKNREKINAYQREYMRQHPEKRSGYQANYWERRSIKPTKTENHTPITEDN